MSPSHLPITVAPGKSRPALPTKHDLADNKAAIKATPGGIVCRTEERPLRFKAAVRLALPKGWKAYGLVRTDCPILVDTNALEVLSVHVEFGCAAIKGIAPMRVFVTVVTKDRATGAIAVTVNAHMMPGGYAPPEDVHKQPKVQRDNLDLIHERWSEEWAHMMHRVAIAQRAHPHALITVNGDLNRHGSWCPPGWTRQAAPGVACSLIKDGTGDPGKHTTAHQYGDHRRIHVIDTYGAAA